MGRVVAGLVLCSCLIQLTACGGSSSNDYSAADNAVSRDISIPFSAVALTASGDAEISCDTVFTVGTGSTDVTLEDFRFFIHDLQLVTSSGDSVPVTLEQNDWQNGAVALLDFQNKADKCSGDAKPLHTTITGTYADDGSAITGLRFRIGVPENRNHLLSAAQPSPLNIASLFWSWQSGYKFMRLDFAPAGGGTFTAGPNVGNSYSAWNFHLGSTGCSGDPQTGATVSCSNLNRPAIELDGFVLETGRVQLNYSALVASNNLTEDSGGAPGCMSGVTDAECNDMFTALGLNLASGDNDSSLLQNAFSIAP